jgi:hypothetical protein
MTNGWVSRGTAMFLPFVRWVFHDFWSRSAAERPTEARSASVI